MLLKLRCCLRVLIDLACLLFLIQLAKADPYTRNRRPARGSTPKRHHKPSPPIHRSRKNDRFPLFVQEGRWLAPPSFQKDRPKKNPAIQYTSHLTHQPHNRQPARNDLSPKRPVPHRATPPHRPGRTAGIGAPFTPSRPDRKITAPITPPATTTNQNDPSTPPSRKYPYKADLLPDYNMFAAAVQAYAYTHAGEAPPKPSRLVYDAYMYFVGQNLALKEQAMFLANVISETSGLQFLEEIACRNMSCAYGKYYGRGYMQLTWEYNYAEASLELFGDNRLVLNPSLVAQPDMGWLTAIWFWNRYVSPILHKHDAVEKYLLGYSVRVINGAIECDGRKWVVGRMIVYNAILQLWGIANNNPGRMTGCQPDTAQEGPTKVEPQSTPGQERNEAPPGQQPIAGRGGQEGAVENGKTPVPEKKPKVPLEWRERVIQGIHQMWPRW